MCLLSHRQIDMHPKTHKRMNDLNEFNVVYSCCSLSLEVRVTWVSIVVGFGIERRSKRSRRQLSLALQIPKGYAS